MAASSNITNAKSEARAEPLMIFATLPLVNSIENLYPALRPNQYDSDPIPGRPVKFVLIKS